MPEDKPAIHPLLARQLQRAGVTDPNTPPDPAAWQKLLGRISRAYEDGDQERYTLERSLQISSTEMQQLYTDLRNTSETRLAEEAQKLRAVVSAVGDGLCVLDQRGDLAFANRAATQLLRMSQEDLYGIPILESILEGGGGDRTKMFFDLMHVDGAVRIDDSFVVLAGAERLPISFVLNPIREEGKVRGAVLVFRDMTQSKQIHEQLLASRANAESASRAKSEFLATMSHEIRTPMNGVLGMISLLRETELSAEQRNYTETVMSSGNALISIIDDILDFSKIEADKLAIEAIDFDLPQVVDEVVDLFADTALARGVLFDCRIEPDVPGRVLGDPGRLRQVITNLISNALKFTSTGGVSLCVRTEEAHGRTLLGFTVQDTGLGIPEDKLGLLFQAFSQTDSSTTREFGGTGLGLVISKRLAELMGGSIGVVSAEGEGSSFHFTVDMPATAPAVKKAPTAVQVTMLAGCDTPMEALQARLQAAGHSTRYVNSMEQALAQLAHSDGQPSLLVMPYDAHASARLTALAERADLARVQAMVTVAANASGGVQSVCAHVRFGELLRLPPRASHLRDAFARLFPKPSSDEEAAHQNAEVALSAGPASRLLLVEDNPMNQRVARAMLERLGHSVHIASNGLEALAAVQRGSFDLILMDCQMPEMDGLEATQRIRAGELAERHLPIVAMTANALKGDREHCLEVGMDDYLAKPVRYEDLAEILQRWLPE